LHIFTLSPSSKAPTSIAPTSASPTTRTPAVLILIAPTDTPTTAPTFVPTLIPTFALTETATALAAEDVDDDQGEDDGGDVEEESTSSLNGPILTDVSPPCTWEETCAVCRGDCNFDEDCLGDLACFHRDYFDLTEVPGCSGIGLFKALRSLKCCNLYSDLNFCVFSIVHVTGEMGRDYCFDPSAYPDALRHLDYDCSEDWKCEKCQGVSKKAPRGFRNSFIMDLSILT